MSDDIDERGSRLEEVMFGAETAEERETREVEDTKETEEMQETKERDEDAADMGTRSGSGSTDSDTTPLVEETHDLHMYLPESRYQDLMGLYKVLDGEYYRVHGDDLEKNRQYFDAVIGVALEHEDEIRERLDI